jgi:phosphoglycolate phosphatase
MPFHATIFDLDGTLLDTLDDIANAANRVLNRRGP